ncbi:hypothetical protein [Rugamonas rivuli]|uniref:Uncharacterized protein n=1 Tax=Rugamonas rivuli TaxID=2743358 RepID=A0A843SNQ5_9BURK|nr:hypothetical protein [Rugamonas rivuli]MQA23640.1 hypothetical protein [Rugamonas rivuli]
MNEQEKIPIAVDLAPAIKVPVTVLTNAEGPMTKEFSMVNCELRKQVNATLMRGSFKVVNITNLRELGTLLNNLQYNQAVTYGRPKQDSGIVVAKSTKVKPEGAIFRDRDHFAFTPINGTLMLDYDPVKGQPAMSADELIAALHKACPELEGVGMLWRPSSSSGVAGAKVRGQRVYIIVSDASQIQRVGKVLFDRLWLAGFGYYAISKSGQALERSPIDAAVWRPEGLDYAAAPILGDDVERIKYDSVIIDGGVFDITTIKDLNAAEAVELKKIKHAKRDEIALAVAEIKQQYIAEAKTEMPKRLHELGIESDDVAVVNMIKRAVNKQVLMGDWPLTTHEGATVTVGMILDNPEKYHNARFADPLEPGHDMRVAVANLYSGGRPYIYSHAHHGVRYELDRAPVVIGVNNAELPRMVDQSANILKKSGEMYEHAGAMVYVNDAGDIIPAKPQWLAVQIQRLCRFEGWNVKKEEMVAAACPSAVVNGLLADAANLRMDKLTAVRNAPTMDCDGRQIVTPGYDKKSGLLLTNEQGGPWPRVPYSPSRADLQKASSILWKPFVQFPYATDADKSVALAAVLTTAVRSCLRTSPGFGFSATAPGTGKTLLAQCVGALYDGVPPPISTVCAHEEEWGKTLFSAARGGTGTLLVDNAEYPIESASLCAVTTAPAIKGRVLGESRDAEAEHRMLILATGNGLQFVGDLNRRFFVCRLDANMEAGKVAARQFDMEPLGYCVKHRLEMTAAALTLIQGYVRAGFPRVCDGLASMDDWNKLVRSTIVWLIEQRVIDGFVDPKVALKRDADTDPDAATLGALLEGTKALFGVSHSFTVSDLIKRTENSSSGVREILLDIAGDRGDINRKKLGQYLLKREGRIMDGVRLKRGPMNRQKTATWEVRMS